jgi:2-polyprenyl-3-methyl-5-hydroxy-6-metoxy-1,4-benzoquinol methylase
MKHADLFNTGIIEVTDAAKAACAALGVVPADYVARHQAADWGEVDQEQREANDFGARYGHDIVSLYHLADGTEIRVETSLDHSTTQLLLASEYVSSRPVGMREGYAIWSASYARERNPLIGVEEFFLPALEFDLRPGTVLDVGSGTGRQALRWARRGARVTAIDQSPEMLAVAQETADTEGLAIDFHVSPIEGGLPVATAAFDLVVCSLMLTHVADLTSAIAECARAVRPGGHLLITDLHPDCTALGWTAGVQRPGIVYVMPGERHPRATYLAAIEESGCGVLQVIDALVRDAPAGYTRASFIRDSGDLPFCLLILARKEQAFDDA